MSHSPIQRLTFSLLAILLSTTFTLVVAEIVLRVFEEKAISASLYFGDTIGGGLKEGGLLKPNYNNYVIDSVGNKVKWITNSGGFRNRNEFLKIKPLNTTRIMALGDSFMAGYRMRQKDSFRIYGRTGSTKTMGNIRCPFLWSDHQKPV